MKRILTLVALSILGLAQLHGQTPFSAKMANSQIQRNPLPSTTDTEQLRAMFEVWKRYGDTRIRDYVVQYADAMVNAQGQISNYKKDNYDLGNIGAGRALIAVSEITRNPKYRKAADILHSQLWEQPRTSPGACWHSQADPYQLWLGDLYLTCPFWAEYAAKYECETDQADDFPDIVKQFLVIAERAYDPASGLYRSGWEETRAQAWSDKTTGQSQCVWGRALGWYAMAIVDALDYIPAKMKGRDRMIGFLQGILDRLPTYRDPATGMWFQVVDKGSSKGNYVEATCSAMFTYAMLKAVRMGYVDPSRRVEAMENYENLLKAFIAEDPAGTVSITKCSAAMPLGGSRNGDGSFAYYTGAQVSDNDPAGVGAFIWASLEYEAAVKAGAAAGRRQTAAPTGTASSAPPSNAQPAAGGQAETIVQTGPAATFLDGQPKFEGNGPETFSLWVMSRVVYPTECAAAGIGGKVVVSFKVGKDGAVSDIKIVSSPDPRLSAEVMRVVKSSPAWTPALVNGKPVGCIQNLPVIFSLQ